MDWIEIKTCSRVERRGCHISDGAPDQVPKIERQTKGSESAGFLNRGRFPHTFAVGIKVRVKTNSPTTSGSELAFWRAVRIGFWAPDIELEQAPFIRRALRADYQAFNGIRSPVADSYKYPFWERGRHGSKLFS